MANAEKHSGACQCPACGGPAGGDAIEAIKEAIMHADGCQCLLCGGKSLEAMPGKNGRRLTEAEAIDIRTAKLDEVAGYSPGVHVVMRRGRLVFRPNRKGNDLDRHPLAIANDRLEAEYRTTVNKIHRKYQLAARRLNAIEARQQKAVNNRKQVLALAQQYPNRTDLIAAKAGISRRRVQQILKKRND